MINTIKQMFGLGPKVDLNEVIKRGAVIVDVRTKSEFASGHAKVSVNIPLDNLRSEMSKLDKSKPIITCCASGIRSATAKNILVSNGFTEVYNGGGWTSVQRLKR